MLIAVFRGMQRGLLVAIFSVIACVVGLAAAIKLSAVVADHLKADAHIHSKWLPILAFVLGVCWRCSFLVRWTANLIEAALDFAFLGWLNKLGGVVLYVCAFYCRIQYRFILWNTCTYYFPAINSFFKSVYFY